MTVTNTVEFLASLLHSRTQVGAYQGSQTDAVTDARTLLDALRTRVVNVIDPTLSGPEVKRQVLDLLDPTITGPSFVQDPPEKPSYVAPPIWML